MNQYNPKIVPVGALTAKERELFAYLAAAVLLRGRQPTLYSLALSMQTDCDTVMGMLERLEERRLIEFTTDGELRIWIPTRGHSLEFGGEVG